MTLITDIKALAPTGADINESIANALLEGVNIAHWENISISNDKFRKTRRISLLALLRALEAIDIQIRRELLPFISLKAADHIRYILSPEHKQQQRFHLIGKNFLVHLDRAGFPIVTTEDAPVSLALSTLMEAAGILGVSPKSAISYYQKNRPLDFRSNKLKEFSD